MPRRQNLSVALEREGKARQPQCWSQDLISSAFENSGAEKPLAAQARAFGCPTAGE
jgi:hypothetical protein